MHLLFSHATMASTTRTLLLFALLPCAAILSAPTTFPGDAAALASLKAAVDPSSVAASSCLASWDFSLDPCAAFPCGLHCAPAADSSYLRVAAVSLDPAGYSGRLPPPVFSSLPLLASLSLAGNRFHGALPGVPLPPGLRALDLSNNAFSGKIPPSLFAGAASLQELYLGSNAFSGQVPAQVAFLVSLTRMELQHNNLTGELPPRMGRMRSLAHLDVSGNALSGAPLGAPGRLPGALVSVVARGNGFVGPLRPEALAALRAMQVLDLTGNAVSGAVPGAAFAHPALQQLQLGSNRLDAVEEPADNGTSSRLVELDLSGNRITGRLPRCVGSMPRLAVVGLDRNRFTGVIPDQYAVRAAAAEATDKGVPFARLMLQGNCLCGLLPSQMAGIKAGSAVVSLVDNCLLTCPQELFFCQGAPQKDPATCPKCDS